MTGAGSDLVVGAELTAPPSNHRRGQGGGGREPRLSREGPWGSASGFDGLCCSLAVSLLGLVLVMFCFVSQARGCDLFMVASFTPSKVGSVSYGWHVDLSGLAPLAHRYLLDKPSSFRWDSALV